MTLGFKANQQNASIVFAAVFVVIWCGAAAVTLNAQLLGGNISFFQSVCILGYCVFPLTLSAVGCLFFGYMFSSAFIKLLVVERVLCRREPLSFSTTSHLRRA